jgi:hypothetical protein
MDDIDEALSELYGDRDEVLQRSVKALLGLDLNKDDEKRCYTDFLGQTLMLLRMH